MRPNPLFAADDPDLVRELIRENPWGIVVSSHDGGLVASHYPIMLDEGSAKLAILSHVGRPDEKLHGLGQSEVLLIVQGRHGYISPSWYPPDVARVPTWNFTVAHCYGVPEILEEAENLRVLGRLMQHFERRVDEPAELDPDVAAQMVRGTVGFRLPITRFVCKRKLSQNKDEVTQRRVIEALRAPGAYEHPDLADEMEQALFGENS